MAIVRFLMIAEIQVPEAADGEIAREEAQLILDGFRESVSPNQYGISLFRTNPYDLAQEMFETQGSETII